MEDNLLKNLSYEFAIKIVKLHQFLTETKKEFVLSKQLLRSGTAIGANVRESEFAENKADFIQKVSLAIKDADLTEYWLELLFRSNYIDESLYTPLFDDLHKIFQLLISIINISQQK